MRLLFAALALAAAAPAAEPPRAVVEAVEFPYYLHPRSLWERELVWLKTIGVRTVAFSIPWNWHQISEGEFDLTGRTSPRRDLVAFIRLLRRLNLEAWVRPLPPVKDWLNSGYPPGVAASGRPARAWLKELAYLLEPQTASHGGPIAWVEGASGFLDAPPPPHPVTLISANDPAALGRSRQTLASGRGALLWEDVENRLYPAGWQPQGTPILRRGAVSFKGEERPSTTALRRDAALLLNWRRMLPGMRPRSKAVRPAAGAFPPGLTATQLVSLRASAVNLVNRSEHPFRGDLRVWDPAVRRTVVLAGAQVPPKEALWLPVSVSLGGGGLCADCAGLAGAERIVYATAELLAVEFENGILAMEFAAPVAGEAVLQLSRRPTGPLLAAGKLTSFDFDERTMRARLPIPQGGGAEHKVRIGLAIEPPEQSAFFADARRLIIGRTNTVSTSYSSPQLAARSRLRLPEGFTARRISKSPNEIDYQIDAPADALHGDWVTMAIEADGVLLGRARVQLFRPASVHVGQAISLHFGAEELPVDPPIAAIDPKAGRNLDVHVRNNWPAIETFSVQSSGEALQFFPAKTEISIGAVMERVAPVRVFADGGRAGLNDWRLAISGGAALEIPVRLAVVPRGEAVAYAADLDGDGYEEWVLENQRARAVFSSRDGGRWIEYVWKDTGANLLPENGWLAGIGPVAVRPTYEGGAATLEVAFGQGKRIVTLAPAEPRLTVDQTVPLPAEALKAQKRGDVSLEVTREAPGRAVYVLSK